MTEQAQRVVADERLNAIQDKAIAVDRASPNVTTSTTFSPALYAQAAQFQIYNQSGTLAAMLGAQGLPPPHGASSDRSEKVQAVDSSASGARLDTLA